MKNHRLLLWLAGLALAASRIHAQNAAPEGVSPNPSIAPIGPVSALTGGIVAPRFPADKASNVNPDTHLILRFDHAPTLGNAGQIRIYDATDDKLVDTLDISIAPGPRPAAARGRGAAPGGAATPPTYQNNIIGGFKEGFHFYPVIIHDNVAVLYPHNNKLAYNKTYYVQIDPGVLTVADDGFKGVSGKDGWTFTTKKAPPAQDAVRLVVAADGSGDFNTVQGAVDFTADKNDKRVTIYIKKGTYEEIVYFRNKTNLTFLGEDREKVIIGYANDETLNGQAADTGKTNELPTTFPYRRAAFHGDHSSGIEIVNLTIKNLIQNGAQGEALLLMGGKNIVSHVSLYGHTDTIQLNDSVYIADSYIEGGTDFIWGRGPAFFNNCDIKELATNPIMWIRSTSASHGFVFLNCTFDCGRAGGPLARNTAAYPESEVVLLNCQLGSFSPAAWNLGGDTSRMHYWEYNSTNLASKKPADTSQRAVGSKQLDKDTDAETIANYSNPAYVLGSWTPKLAETDAELGLKPAAGK